MPRLRIVVLLLAVLALLVPGGWREVAVCMGSQACSGTVHVADACPCDAHGCAVGSAIPADLPESASAATCTCRDIIIGSAAPALAADRRALPDPARIVPHPACALFVAVPGRSERRQMSVLPRPPPSRSATLGRLATVRLLI